jgi:hypothetical protein
MTPRQTIALALALAALVGAVNAAILLALAGGLLSPWVFESAGYAAVFALVLAPVATAVASWAVARRVTRSRRARRGQCPVCAYELRGVGPVAVCPECGEPFEDPDALRGAPL